MWIEDPDGLYARMVGPVAPANLIARTWREDHWHMRFEIEREGLPPLPYSRTDAFLGSDWRAWDKCPTPEEREWEPWRR